MDNAQIHLPGCEVSGVTVDAGTLRIAFSRAYIIKTMTGSAERTRWWQAADLVLEGLESEGVSGLPGPLVCAGGDIDDNIFTYRDMLPVPFETRGRVRFLLRFEGVDGVLDVAGRQARLETREVPKYIEHLRPGG